MDQFIDEIGILGKYTIIFLVMYIFQLLLRILSVTKVLKIRKK